MKKLLGISSIIFLASLYYSLGNKVNSYSPNEVHRISKIFSNPVQT
jgi:hypothetical protein